MLVSRATPRARLRQAGGGSLLPAAREPGVTPPSALCSSQGGGAPPSEPAPLSFGLMAAVSNRSGLRSQA